MKLDTGQLNTKTYLSILFETNCTFEALYGSPGQKTSFIFQVSRIEAQNEAKQPHSGCRLCSFSAWCRL